MNRTTRSGWLLPLSLTLLLSSARAQDELPSLAPSAAVSTSETLQPTIETNFTESPYPNACDNITIGSFYFLLANSINSADEVSVFGFEDLPPNLDLYLTDNAWMGESFATNEGVLLLTTPATGIAAGSAFGFGPSTTAYRHGQDWTTAQGVFSLSTEGEQVFLFCHSAQKAARPIAAISYNGPFQPAGLPSYGTNESALPDSLSANGTIILPHEDRWEYAGPKVLEVDALKAAIQDTDANWQGSSSDGSSATWWWPSCGVLMVAVTALSVA
jgi:hypothetical protein